MCLDERRTGLVLRTPIDSLSWDEALQRISSWANNCESRYVCICNVHSCVTANQDSKFHQVVKEADMATPDGAPVAWMLRKLGYKNQERINGPDLMWKYCAMASETNLPIYLYGGEKITLDRLKKKLLTSFPALNIAGAYSPPFRALNKEEDEEIVKKINDSGARVVWVSLGCPKQELWMAEHRGRINAVMIGVGAAFDYHAGTLQRAPNWMQKYGLEWFYRLYSEPRRLWKRYMVTNSIFIFSIARQFVLNGFRF